MDTFGAFRSVFFHPPKEGRRHLFSHSEQRLILEVIHDFLRQKYPDESGGVNKKAAARALAQAADPDHWDKEAHEQLWRARVRRIVERRKAFGGESLFNPSIAVDLLTELTASNLPRIARKLRAHLVNLGPVALETRENKNR